MLTRRHNRSSRRHAKDLVTLLTRARHALRPGGVLVSFHEGLTGGRTAPEPHVVGRLIPALHGQDLSFDHGTIAAAMRAAGFTRMEERMVETPFGPMVAETGRQD